jgi:hypothetical protein
MRADRHFVIGARSKSIRPIGMGVSSSLSNQKRAILPISITHFGMSKPLGLTSRGRGVLLLEDGLGQSDIQGNGFGVKSHNAGLLDKLQKLSLKSIQGKLPRKKNVSISF